MDVLLLGGTGLARRLAVALADAGLSCVTSLAGVTRQPASLPGEVRVGGFGGVAGLVAWLRAERPRCVVNATHAFAATMSAHAAVACAEAGVPLARVLPPSWSLLPAAASWTWVGSHAEAATVVAGVPGRVLLTVGRQGVAEYLPLSQRDVTVRVVDPPEVALPARWRLIEARGPFEPAAERELLRGVDVVVAKDAGGVALDARLVAATEAGTRVVMLRRPPSPGYGDAVADVAAATAWARQRVAGATAG